MVAAIRRTGMAVLLVIAASACGPSVERCNHTQMAALASPDDRHEAVVFVRDCGPFTGISTHVSVRAPDKLAPTQPGNGFAVDGVAAVSVLWRDPLQLVITHPADADVLWARPAVEEVKISYLNE